MDVRQMIWRIATFASVGLAAGYVGMLFADRDPPTDILHYQVLTPSVAPGGALLIQYTVRRTRACQTIFQRLYRDGIGVRFAEDSTTFIWQSPAPMGRDEYTVRVPISPHAAPGVGSFRGVAVYRCNWTHVIKPIIETQPPIEFRILGNPKEGD